MFQKYCSYSDPELNLFYIDAQTNFAASGPLPKKQVEIAPSGGRGVINVELTLSQAQQQFPRPVTHFGDTRTGDITNRYYKYDEPQRSTHCCPPWACEANQNVPLVVISPIHVDVFQHGVLEGFHCSGVYCQAASKLQPCWPGPNLIPHDHKATPRNPNSSYTLPTASPGKKTCHILLESRVESSCLKITRENIK